MMPVDLLIFDLDGTLCDTKDDIATSVNLTLRELNLPEKSFEEIYTYVGSGVRKLLQQAVGSKTDEGLQEVLKVFRGHYMRHLLDSTQPYSGIPEVLDHFGSKKKAVVTNKPQDYTDPILQGLQLTSHFELVVGSNNGLPLKPSPDMILLVLSKLGVARERCVMIGDGIQDIAAARASGIKVCAVGYGLGDPQSLKAAVPDFFCREPKELQWLFG
jgi:phosphoglycolate phosphatase